MILIRKKHFYAAHRNQSLRGKCSNIHGHRYGIEVHLQPTRTRAGVTMLFADVDKVVDPIIDEYDHSMLINARDPYLKDLKKIKNADGDPIKLVVMKHETSVENVAARLFKQLTEGGLPVVDVLVEETDSGTIVYTRTDYMRENTVPSHKGGKH
tara:strand:+ start:474 stop:935 length:462 start_codon:yes stop_codon:yes gene_type:complete